jgi:uncharacterized protein (TIGR02217 family)
MSDILFPALPGIAWDVTWTPTFHTKIQSAVNGKEYRTSLMANPIYNLKVKFEFLRHGARQELRKLVGFYLARRGAYDSFLFKLDDDSSVTDQTIAAGDGATKTFQLVRSFGSEFSEPVQNVDVIREIKVKGVVVPPAGYTVSPTGMVTFSVPPVGPVVWSGSYFYRARFADDEQDFDRFMQNLWKAGSVQLVACLGTRI